MSSSSSDGEVADRDYKGLNLAEQELGPVGCLFGICPKSVPTGSVGVVQQLGRYIGYQEPGFMLYCPPICSVETVSLATQQMMCTSDCKTRDNVTVTVSTAVQYKIDKHMVKTAVFDIIKPKDLIEAYVDDVLRSTLPTLNLDEAYSAKERICGELIRTVKHHLSKYGYIILNVLVTDLRPNQAVLIAMNEINASRRHRQAAIEKGEADKTLKVKAAEADAEAKFLAGQGVARMRMAMVDGYKASMNSMEECGLSPPDAMHMMITTQYLDTLKEFASNGRTSAIMVPTGPSPKDLEAQVRDGFLASAASTGAPARALAAPVQRVM